MKKHLAAILAIILLFTDIAYVPFSWAQSANSFNKAAGKINSALDQDGSASPKSFGGSQINTGNTQQSGVNIQGLSSPSVLSSISSISYSVHVLGYVKFPGNYKITPSDKLSDAINLAGGILPNGSQRLVQIRRSESIKTYDTYLYNYYGKIEQNPFLLDNDTVYVPEIKGQIEIEGPVNRTGTFEITKNTTLLKAIDLAGGFTTGASKKDPIRIIRYDENEKKNVIEVEIEKSAMKKFVVQKGDIIIVSHLLLAKNTFDYEINRIPGDNIFYPTKDNNVYVIGAVNKPGPYEFMPSFTFKEYVNLAGPTRNIGSRSVKIFDRSGKRRTVTKSTIINPGDTLMVPEQRWKPEVMIGLISSILSVSLSSIVLIDQLKN